MSGQKLPIKNDNPWDTLVIAEGAELKVGVRMFYGPRVYLIGGKETEICEPIWNGDYNLDNGKIVKIVDGIVQEIIEAATPATEGATGMKAQAMARREKYKK